MKEYELHLETCTRIPSGRMVDFGFVVGPWLPLAEADASRLTARRRLGLSFVAEKYTWDSNNGL